MIRPDDIDEIALVFCRRVSTPHDPRLSGQWEWVKAIGGGPGGAILRPIIEEVVYQPKARAKAKTKTADPIEDSPAAEEQREAIRKSSQSRHRGYLAMLEGLKPVDDETRDYLTRNRLLTNKQIDLMQHVLGLRQIRRNQLLPAATGLPGFGADGRYKGPSGILVPSVVRDYDGELCIAGFQIASAPSELAAGIAKYKFVSIGKDKEGERDSHYQKVVLTDSEGKTHVEEGSLFSCVLTEKPDEAICVDSSFKTFITAVRQGSAAFGSPGMQYASRYRQLKTELLRSVGLNGRVIIALDSGDGVNPGILANAVHLSKQLERDGFDVSFWIPPENALTEKQSGADIDDVSVRSMRRNRKTARQVEKLLMPSVVNTTDNRVGILEAKGIRAQTLEDSVEIPWLNDEKVERFPAGKRTEAVKAALDAGFRLILCKDGTGTGKSHWAASLADSGGLAALGVKQVLVLSSSPYEAAHFFQQKGLDVALLRGRNAGIKENAQGQRFVMQDEDDLAKGERMVAEFNCIHLDRLSLYQRRELGPLMSGLCSSCEMFDDESCGATEGMFLHDRLDALSKDVVVMHPASLVETFLLQHCDDDGLSQTLIIADDLTEQAFFRDRRITLAQVQRFKKHFTGSRSLKLNSILFWLENAMVGGNELNSDSLRKLFEADYGQRADRGICWTSLLEEEVRFVRNSTEDESLICWLELLHLWMTEQASGWIDKAGLHFKHRNRQLLGTLKRARAVVALDATGSAEVWKRLLSEDAAVIKQEAESVGADVAIRQIIGCGNLGFTRSGKERFRLAVALAALTEQGELVKAESAICEIKSGLSSAAQFADIQLTWLGSSRGSNVAQACKHLVLVGTPNTNLGAAAGSFELLFGRSVDITATLSAVYPMYATNRSEQVVTERKGTADPGFRRYYSHQLASAYEQGFGRLRSAIRPDENGLRVTAITDAPLPFPVELVELKDLIGDELVEAMGRCTDTQIKKVAFALAEAGIKPTPEAIAERLGCPVWILRAWLDSLGYRPRWMAAAKATAKKNQKPKAQDSSEVRVTDENSTLLEGQVESAEVSTTVNFTGLVAA